MYIYTHAHIHIVADGLVVAAVGPPHGSGAVPQSRPSIIMSTRINGFDRVIIHISIIIIATVTIIKDRPVNMPSAAKSGTFELVSPAVSCLGKQIVNTY